MKKITPMKRLQQSLKNFEENNKMVISNSVNLNHSEPKMRSIYSYETYEDFFKDKTGLTSNIKSDFIKIYKIFQHNITIGIAYYFIEKEIEEVIIRISIKTEKGIEFNYYKFEEFKNLLNKMNKEFKLPQKRDIKSRVKYLIKEIKKTFKINKKEEILKIKKEIIKEKTINLEREKKNTKIRLKRKEEKLKKVLEKREEYLEKLIKKYDIKKIEDEYKKINEKLKKEKAKIKKEIEKYDEKNNTKKLKEEYQKEVKTLEEKEEEIKRIENKL